jgi:nucleotide-binding universal stress UspA family protein
MAPEGVAMTNRSVLVPLDGTANSEVIIERLRHLCDESTDLILLTVRRPERRAVSGFEPGATVTQGGVGATPDQPRYVETTDQIIQEEIGESKDYLEGLAKGLRAGGYQVSTQVLIDEHPAEAIIKYAGQVNPTYIAMLRRTHSPLHHLLFGSVATAVLEADVAPVLIVPPVRT